MMEWIERLNQTIGYMEEHLKEEIDYGALAKIAGCSVYHFQRMFAYMSNVPLSEYIRRRRMTLAAVDIQNGRKILDVALDYGYASPTAFNRAFQSVHGVAPSAAKESGVGLKSFPPISFIITIKGAEVMDYRIEKKDAFRVVGISHPLDKDIEKNFEVVPKMWTKLSQGDTLPKLVGLMDSEPSGILGISMFNDAEEGLYIIGAASSKAIDETLEEFEIPAFTWAVFPGEGVCPQAIQDLEKRIVTEWLPTSGYEYANGPDVERYLTPDPQNAKFEVWIPVIKK